MSTKILLLTEVFPPQHGGSGRWFWEIYHRFPTDVVQVAAGLYPDADVFDEQHDLQISRLPLTLSTWGVASWTGFKGYWNSVRRVIKIVRRDRITMLHTGRSLPEGVMAMTVKMLTGIPYVCYVHGEDINTAWSSRELVMLTRQALHRANLCIANSHNTARLLREDWDVPEANIQVIHPGVDTERFIPAARSKEARQALQWGARPVILTVGRLQQRKGHDIFLQSLPAIKETFPNVLYSIIGDGQERSRLQKLVEELKLQDNVEFRGETTDSELVSCYQQCDLFALPNREVDGDIEGFGMVLLEAQACGTPVLAGDSGGTAETMCVGETGLIVDCTTTEKLSLAVVELLSDNERRARMGVAARNWVVQRFDWSALAREASRLFAIAPESA